MNHIQRVASVGFVACALAASPDAQPRELWFATGAPELIEPPTPVVDSPLPLFTIDNYGDFLNTLRNPDVIPPTRFPNVSPEARIGVNLWWADRMYGFVVDEDAAGGYRLYADLNGNGSVADETPIRLEPKAGYFTTLIAFDASQTRNGEAVTYPVLIRINVARTPDGELKHTVIESTVRRGVAELAGQRVAFSLSGIAGHYDEPTNSLWIDMNGDGRGFDAGSPEVLRVREKTVNIGGTGYEFRVDHFGRGLALRPLGRAAPARPSFAPGTAAPAFSFRDIEGRTHTLADYRGQVLLLDFWATWCAPCRAEAPALNAIYDKYRTANFTVVGVSTDSVEEIRQYATEQRHVWTQAMEPADGPLQLLFRVVGLPTHVLIGRDGKIVARLEEGIADDAAAFENLVRQAIDRKP